MEQEANSSQNSIPLLAEVDQQYSTLNKKQHDNARLSYQQDPASINKKVLRVFLDSLPITLSFFSFLFDRSMLIYLLKQQGSSKEVIASFGISTSFQALAAVSIISTLQTGLLSRVSQAYGANNIRLAGLYFQRGMVIGCGALCFCLLPLIFSKNLLQLLDASESQAKMGQDYLHRIMPGISCQLFFFSIQSTLNACKIYTIPAFSVVFGAMVQLGMGYLFVAKYDAGLNGVGIAQSIGWMTTLILLILIIKFKNPVPGLFYRFSKESFVGIWDLLKFQLICGLQGWAKMVASEANNLTSIKFSSADQAAFTVSANMHRLLLSPNGGLSTSLQAHLGNTMGSKDGKAAKSLLNRTLLIAFVVVIFIESITFAFRDSIIGSQTDDDTYDIAISLLNIYMVSIPFEFLTDLYKSASKTIGKEKLAAKLTLIIYIVYNIPATYLFGFEFGWEVRGLVLATTSGAMIMAIFFLIMTNIQDWDKCVKDVANALENSSTIYRRLTIQKEQQQQQKQSSLNRSGCTSIEGYSKDQL